MIRVLVNGSNGKMGQEVIKAISKSNEFYLFGGVDRTKRDNSNYRTYLSVSELSSSTDKPDVIVDFSVPEASLSIINYAASFNIPIVIATTGFSIEDENKILEYSEAIPIFKSSNMSYGIHLFSDLVSKFSKKLNDVKINMDIEIIEKHHRRKVDAPSRYCPYDS